MATTAWLTFWSFVLEASALLYLTRDLGLAPAMVGVILAVSNVGLLLGALSAPRIVAVLGVGPALLITLAAAGLADLVMPLVGWTPLVGVAPLAVAAILIAAQFVFGLAVVVFKVTAGGLRLASTPDALRGRMAATTQVLVLGLTPVGALVGGLLGEAIGPQATLALAAGAEVLAVVGVAASRLRSVRALPTDPDG